MDDDSTAQNTKQTSEASPIQTPVKEAGMGTTQQPRKKKKLIIAIVAAVLLVLVAGGAVFGYVWYQNPEKMVTDAFGNMAKSESVTLNSVIETSNTSGEPEAAKVMVEGRAADNRAEAAISVEGKTSDYDVKANGNVVFAGDDGLFFKVTNVQEILETVVGEDTAKSELYAAIIEKTNDQWIKLDADSNEGMTREFEEQRKCVNTVAKNYASDKAQQRQLADAYKGNRLFKVEKTAIEAIDGVNSHKFELKLDESKIDGFVAALKTTDVAKAYDNCFEEDVFKGLEGELRQVNEESGDSTVAVWVSTWSHEFTQVQATGKDNGAMSSVTVKLKFNEEVKIDTPQNAVPVKDIMEEITKLIFAEGLSQRSGTPVAPSEIDQDLLLTQ